MKIYLEIYGCTANQSDASLIKGLLRKENYKVVDAINDADVLVLLTCTVIGTTEQRMLSRLRAFKKTGKRIIVSGCMVSVQSFMISSIVPDALLLPPKYVHHIIDLLHGKDVLFKERNKTKFPKGYDGILAPIAIAEGCVFSCSYCITALARGKLTSYPIEEIMDNVRTAVEEGRKEIQLTAQDTASYGLDIEKDLGTLLSHICSIQGSYRIRVGMMNPYTVLRHLDSIIRGYNDSKVYKFLHLPVQSGDDTILRKMGRRYSLDDFLSITTRFRDIYPTLMLSTDVIVGFPTETDEHFQNTIKLVKMVKPDIVNITRFSARPFTKAKSMKGRIRTDVMKERSRQLTDLSNTISKANNQSYIGKTCSVLLTEKGKKNTVVNTVVGRLNNYKPVVIRDTRDIGRFVTVEITDVTSTYLIGNLI